MKREMSKNKKKEKKSTKKTKQKKQKEREKEETEQTPSVRFRPINFDFGQFDFGQLAEVELSEVELAEVEHPLWGTDFVRAQLEMKQAEHHVLLDRIPALPDLQGFVGALCCVSGQLFPPCRPTRVGRGVRQPT